MSAPSHCAGSASDNRSPAYHAAHANPHAKQHTPTAERRASPNAKRAGFIASSTNNTHGTPIQYAAGVGAGMFAGLIPGSNPVQFTAAALLAIAFRVNLPIALIVTLYSNPFTIVPLYYLAYQLGKLALGESGGTLPPFAFSLEGKSLSDWLPAAFDWITSIGKPLLVGLPLLAVLLSIVSYFGVRCAWRCYVVHA